MNITQRADRYLLAVLKVSNINLSTNEISPLFFSGQGSVSKVYLSGYEKPTFKIYFVTPTTTSFAKLPLGIETNTVYFLQQTDIHDQNKVKLYLTAADLDNDTPFDFTTENTVDFVEWTVGVVEYKHTPFPCVEKAATDVEDMFCCPPAPDPEYRPEYITLNTGSADDSGNYYINEYPFTLGDSQAIINYKSRNQAYVPITRVQSNIYDGPIVYGTYDDTYTLRWEITTEVGDIGSDTPPGPIGPAGYKRNRVKLFIDANFRWNPVVYNVYGDYKFPQSISLVEIYASPWVLLDDFSYSATCTLIGNNDTDYMYPSVPEYFGSPPVPMYYDTPAGLPIPHTVTLTPSANHTVFPASVRLVLKDAKFLTPPTEGDRVFNNQLVGFYGSIALGDFDLALTFNESLGGFYSEVLTLYGIKGRFSLDGITHLTKTRWEDYTLRGTGFPYAIAPETLYCNDIETNRGPLRGRTLPGMIISTVSLVAGIGHGNVFYDSRWKINRVVGPAPYYPTLFTYFSWDEKNQSMFVTFSQYSSAIKRPYGYGGDFFHTNFFSVYSGHPDSYYSSLVTLPTQPGTPPPPS